MDIVFVNYAGNRTRVPAKIGESILSAALNAKYTFVDGKWLHSLCAISTYVVATLNWWRFSPGACGGGGKPIDFLHKEGSW